MRQSSSTYPGGAAGGDAERLSAGAQVQGGAGERHLVHAALEAPVTVGRGGVRHRGAAEHAGPLLTRGNLAGEEAMKENELMSEIKKKQ